MASNEAVYRVGDHVYVEDVPAEPFQVRRIEELIRTAEGVDAKLSCFYRRSEISSSLIEFADENLNALVEDEHLSEEQKKFLADREVFSSNMLETVSASMIRGKCSVLRVSDVESATSYLGKDDLFFYCYMYEPSVRTLMCDDGEIRVGPEYQVKDSVMNVKIGGGTKRKRKTEVLVWNPDNGLDDKAVDDYLERTTKIATLARALDGQSKLQRNSLVVSAASASRDRSKFHAMDQLHKSSYNVPDAIRALVPSSGRAVVVRDELENWTSQEAELFKEGMERIGKDFWAIRQELLPWKSMKNIVEYYYLWKTTDGYDKTKTVKSAEAKTRLVKITMPPPEAFVPQNPPNAHKKSCANCKSSSTGFNILPFRIAEVCRTCWDHWKRYAVVMKSPKLEME